MTNDTGFAPNPFFGILSLATCKSLIRESKNIGEFIAGFTSKALCSEKIGEERLVFIMKISGKLTYAQYYNDEKFSCKRASGQSRITQSGDNIYYLENDEYKQGLAYFHRDEKRKTHDLISDKVLLSNEFFYFGSAAIPINQFGIRIPKTQSSYGVRTVENDKIESLWKYLKVNFKKNSLIGPPHTWKKGEAFNANQNGCQ